jgi:hypothetical protein
LLRAEGMPLTVMTKKSEQLLDQLIAVAGDADTVEEALRSLIEEADSPPQMRDIVRRILEIRERRNQLAHSAK